MALSSLFTSNAIFSGPSQKTGIFLENNPDDFQTKLKYYVSQLKNLQLTPRPTSDSAFCPESKE